MVIVVVVPPPLELLPDDEDDEEDDVPPVFTSPLSIKIYDENDETSKLAFFSEVKLLKRII